MKNQVKDRMTMLGAALVLGAALLAAPPAARRRRAPPALRRRPRSKSRWFNRTTSRSNANGSALWTEW